MAWFFAGVDDFGEGAVGMGGYAWGTGTEVIVGIGFLEHWLRGAWEGDARRRRRGGGREGGYDFGLRFGVGEAGFRVRDREDWKTGFGEVGLDFGPFVDWSFDTSSGDYYYCQIHSLKGKHHWVRFVGVSSELCGLKGWQCGEAYEEELSGKSEWWKYYVVLAFGIIIM
jgi:hypothetical protein